MEHELFVESCYTVFFLEDDNKSLTSSIKPKKDNWLSLDLHVMLYVEFLPKKITY